MQTIIQVAVEDQAVIMVLLAVTVVMAVQVAVCRILLRVVQVQVIKAVLVLSKVMMEVS